MCRHSFVPRAAAAAVTLGLLAAAGCRQPAVERVGWVIGIRKEAIPEYVRMHANPPPEVVQAHKDAHIRNYTIYLAEVEPDEYYLFAYLEYTGDDFAADLARLKEKKVMQDWLAITDPTQKPVPLRKPGEWWMRMEPIFRID